MLIFVTSKSEKGVFKKLFNRLEAEHHFIHSSTLEAIKKSIYAVDTDGQSTIYIFFDLYFMFEQNDDDLFTLLQTLKNEKKHIFPLFYYYADSEPLLYRNVERLKNEGYEDIFAAETATSLAMSLNTFIIKNGLHKKGKTSQRPAKTSCITIGVMGACSRIGTTTQALQMMMYLKSIDYNVGLIQTHKDIETYVGRESHSKYLSDTEFSIDNLRFYSLKDEKTALNDNDFLLYDYGSYEKVSNEDVSAWLKKDVRVSVMGNKNNETAFIPRITNMDKSCEFTYIYSFVGERDKPTVLNSMGNKAGNTYFADYTPDYFAFGGNNEMYARILSIEVKQEETKARAGLFKVFAVFH